MIDLFPAAFAVVVFGIEKEHSNDPNDPGGDTWWGLARRYHPEITPWPPTLDTARGVYRAKYWDAHRCGEMPWPWALAVFDGSVNQGGVVRLAQQALGVGQDGAVGAGTLAAMRAATDEHFADFMALRQQKYVTEPGYARDGRGWFKRAITIAMKAAVPPQKEE